MPKKSPGPGRPPKPTTFVKIGVHYIPRDSVTLIKATPTCTHVHLGNTILMLSAKPEAIISSLWPDYEIIEAELS